MAVKKNFTIDGGSDKTVYFYFRDANGLIDLSGYNCAMQIASGDKIIDTLTTSNNRIYIEGENGSIIVRFYNRATEKYPKGDLRYDIELESPDGCITRVVEGVIKVSQGITSVKSITHEYYN